MHLAIEPAVVCRLLLLSSHLLLCAFALHCVITTDWRLLHGRIDAPQLLRTHGHMVWLLAGLWLSGVALAGIDLGWSLAELPTRPKLLAKLSCVLLLSFNGVLLRAWCFPRLASRRQLGRVEAMAVMVCGAVSSTSWLMAAFFGIARTLQHLSLSAWLAMYWVALALAVPVALLLEARLRQGRDAAPDAPAGGSAEHAAASGLTRFKAGLT